MCSRDSKRKDVMWTGLLAIARLIPFRDGDHQLKTHWTLNQMAKTATLNAL
jgi:hypothetical protein